MEGGSAVHDIIIHGLEQTTLSDRPQPKYAIENILINIWDFFCTVIYEQPI